MDLLEKIIDLIVWILIIGGMSWFFYGYYKLIDLFFIRG